MAEHLSAQTIAHYRQKSLTPQELLKADDHLAECAACREALMGDNALQDAFSALRSDLLTAGKETPEHLSYETLVAYVESTNYGVTSAMDAIDREIVESHIEICSACASEVRELRAFQTLVTPALQENYAPRSPWERWTAAWTSRRRLLPLTLGTALGAALLAVVFALHPWQNSAQLPAEIAATRPPASGTATSSGQMPERTVPSTEMQPSHETAHTAVGAMPPKSAHTDAPSPGGTLKPSSSPGTQVAQNPRDTPDNHALPGDTPSTPSVPSGEIPKVANNGSNPAQKPSDAAMSGAALPGGPTDAKGYAGRASIALRQRDYDKAIADYARATELDARYGPAWEGLSWSQYLAGRYDDALASNAKALELSKETPTLHFRRGLIYAAKDNWDAAQPEYKQGSEGASRAQKSVALKEAQTAQVAHRDVAALARAVEFLGGTPSP